MTNQVDLLMAEVGAKYGLSDELYPEDGVMRFTVDGITLWATIKSSAAGAFLVERAKRRQDNA